MTEHYLGSKYQTSFNRMLDGECHRIIWDGPDPRKKELSDLILMNDTIRFDMA
jgi:hypothetical protein